VTGFCEGSNEHSDSVNGGEFRDRRAVGFSKNKGFAVLQSACCCVEGSLIVKAICLTQA
jgi:hypothetical protein